LLMSRKNKIVPPCLLNCAGVPALSELGGYHININMATVMSERMIFATN
jgi:hypothetical protein